MKKNNTHILSIVLRYLLLLTLSLFNHFAYAAYAEDVCTAFGGQSKCVRPLNPEVKGPFSYTLTAGSWGTVYGSGITPQQAADGYNATAGPMPPSLCTNCNAFGRGTAYSPLLGRSPSTLVSSARDIYAFANFEGYLANTRIIPVKDSSGYWHGNASITGVRDVIGFRCPPNTIQVGARDSNKVRSPFLCQLPLEPKKQCDNLNKNNPIKSTCGNPIDFVSGNKIQKELDWSVTNGLLSVSRSYNSLLESQYITGTDTFKSGLWEFNYNKSITLIFNTLDVDNLVQNSYGSAQPLFPSSPEAYNWQNKPTAFYPMLRINRSGGNTQTAYFDSATTDANGAITKITFKTDQKNNGIKIDAFPDGSWLYSDQLSGVFEVYNQQGQLIRINYLNGQFITLSYSNIQLNSTTLLVSMLSKVIDKFGRSLQFGYNPQGLISTITLPNNKHIIYQYDVQNRLVSVTRPSYGTKTYHYSENSTVAPSGNPNLLTGITDEKGNRFATYTYDNKNRAISTEHGQGINRYTIDYSQGAQAKVTDARNKISTYDLKNVQGYNTATTLSENGLVKVSLSFDAFGNIISTSKNGMITQFTYDPQLNLETSRTEAVGTAQERKIETTWHSDFPKPTEIKESSGNQIIKITTYSYDTSGNVLTKITTDPIRSFNWIEKYEYNDVSQITSFTNHSGHSTNFRYNTNGNLVKKIEPSGVITTYSLHNASGLPTRIVQDATVTNIVYDDADRIVELRQSIDTTSLSRQQSGSGLSWWQQLVNTIYSTVGAEVPYPESEITYTTNAQTLATQQAITKYQYDLRGLLTSSTLPDGERIEYSYDDAHRLAEIKDQSGNRTVYTLNTSGDITQTEVYGASGQLEAKNQQVYDNLGRLQQTLGNNQQSQTLAYDSYDQVSSDKNTLNQSYYYTYDVLGRQIKETDPLNGISQNEYNALDQLKKVTDANGNATTYEYDAQGNLIKQVSPDIGQTLYYYYTQDYFRTGLLSSKRNSTSKFMYYHFSDGRVTLKRVLDNNNIEKEREIFNYSMNPGVQGRLLTAINSRAEVAFSYDPSGLVRQKSIQYLTTQQSTAPTFKVHYSYTLGGKLKQLALPSGNVINYDYNATGQMTGIRLNDQSFIGNIQYSANGLKGWVYSGVGDSVQFAYDLDGRITRINMPNVFDKNYSFDSADRILSITDSYQSLLNQSFKHDALSRLTEQTTTEKTFKYTYDKNSNRLMRQTVQGTTTNTENYTIASNSNRLTNIQQGTSNKAYQYLATGQITNDGVRSYTYDAQGRSESISRSPNTILNAYDAFGQRIQKFSTTAGSQSQTLFVYDENGQLLGEYSPDGKVIREYIWLDGTLVGLRSYQYPNEILRVHTDHLGTPRAISNNSNQVLWRWDGDQFGDVQPTGNLDFPIRHAGQYYDAEVGIFYNYFRDYDPITGRYIESDPIGLDGGLNTYGYVGGNPLGAVDPTGEAAVGGILNGATSLIRNCPIGRVISLASGVISSTSACDMVVNPPENKCDDNDCSEIIARINAQTKIVRDRYYEMLLDRHNLHRNNKAIKNKHSIYGSWVGHQQQYTKQQGILKSLILEAIFKGCEPFIPLDAKKWAYKPAPNSPNRTEAENNGYS